MQKTVSLSTSESELIQYTECAQDMMYRYRLLKEMDLQVELPMILRGNNQRAIDIVNSWSSTGRTRHIDVRYKFLRELKESNLIRMVWCSSKENEADVFTKNLHKPAFDKCIRHFVGEDQYMCEENRPLKGESVGDIT